MVIDHGRHHRDEVAVYARTLDGWRILEFEQRLLCELAYPDRGSDGSDAVARCLASDALDEVQRVIRQRERAAKIDARIVDPRSPRYTDWAQVARQVKAIVSVPDVLEDLGHPVRRTGTARGRDEFHAPCPWCGGHDRFIVFGQPDSNFTCRQCRVGGDVIDLTTAVLQVDFVEACRRLAALAGVAA